MIMPYANQNSVRIHYEVEGAGPPLLLYHGFSGSLDDWRDAGWVASLQQSYRLILVDGRGHGGSDKPRSQAAYTLAQRVSDVLAVLDHLGVQRAHYLGYSLGGWLGFGLARFAPHRLQSLTLLGAHPYAESMAFYREGIASGLAPWVAALGTLAGQLPPGMQQRILANDLQALAASVAADRDDISDVLPTTFTPTLLAVGTADPRLPGVERAASVMPRARLVTPPDENHLQLFFASDFLLSRICRFLHDVDAGNRFSRDVHQHLRSSASPPYPVL
jgi:pimeloyl-ACP methyl ester carboxylesterase